jgi:integrase
VSGEGVHEDKPLKQRAAGTVREVPLPPALVQILKRHLARFDPVDGRVFTTSSGRPLTSTSYSETWQRARAKHWGPDSPLVTATLYDLRHSAATLMLRAGVPPAEVARRLGHSVDVLMRIYAGVLQDERGRANLLIEAEQQLQLAGDDH